MNSPRLRFCLFCCALFLVLQFRSALADVPVPGNVLDPRSAPEAWNVIRLSTTNVDQLIREKRWPEIPVQISLCSPALRALAGFSDQSETKLIADRTLGWVVALARASVDKDEARTIDSLKTLRANLAELAGQFDPRSVAADIFFCPMHPDFVSELATTPCAKCGMALLPRRIPYSFIYMIPGKPSIGITATTDVPIEAGRKVSVKLQFKRGDGSPVRSTDFLVMHTQPIHLLIEDPSLSDYHHEHPVAMETPGEYVFSFTPKKTAPYRIWADIVPAVTGVQELPYVDLPAQAKGEAVANTEDRLTCTSGGLNFTLTFKGGPMVTARAHQTCVMQIVVNEADGNPVTRLEPLMNAFAHLVGFYDDYQTVVHLHPGGGDILRADARGGPKLNFTFYPPKPGFIRLYCQVSVNGEYVFAPFNLNVAP
ncbi:MAG: hypothetical protein WCF18_23305 [Chthoniobacteraceae bacterium]